MKYALFDADGCPNGFYSKQFHGDAIPADAVQISNDQWAELLEYPGRRRWLNGALVVFEPPAAVPTIDDYRIAIQSAVDATAQMRRYDNGNSLASYVASTNEVWAGEAQAFVAWRDAVWANAYEGLEKFETGEPDQPSVSDIVGKIKPIAWPS